MDEDQEAELRNPFPAPPAQYTNYTKHNLELLALLKSRTEGLQGGDSHVSSERETDELDVILARQSVVLADRKDVPEWSLFQLEKPRVDWIVEDGHYSVFGDSWLVSCVLYDELAARLLIVVFGDRCMTKYHR